MVIFQRRRSLNLYMIQNKKGDGRVSYVYDQTRYAVKYSGNIYLQ